MTRSTLTISMRCFRWSGWNTIFDMGETDPLGLVASVEGLGDADRAAIGGGNAARVFGWG